MNLFERYFYRLNFSADDRYEFYDDFMNYIKDGIPIKDVFQKMILNYTLNGQRPNSPMAKIIKECAVNLDSGLSLANSLREWFPDQEIGVIEAANLAGKDVQGFVNAMAIAKGMGRLSAAKNEAIFVSVYLVSMIFGVVALICGMLVPIILQSVPLEQWNSAQKAVYYFYLLVTDYIYLVLIFFVSVSAFLRWLLPRWTGNVRFFFDSYPPFSIYKHLQGAAFILNVDAMISSGVTLKESMERITSSSRSDWLKERVTAVKNALDDGEGNLGIALSLTGYEFPGSQAIVKLQSIFETKNNEGSLKRYGEKWLEKTIKNVEKACGRLRMLSMFSAVFALGGVVFVMFDLLQSTFNFQSL